MSAPSMTPSASSSSAASSSSSSHGKVTRTTRMIILQEISDTVETSETSSTNTTTAAGGVPPATGGVPPAAGGGPPAKGASDDNDTRTGDSVPSATGSPDPSATGTTGRAPRSPGSGNRTQPGTNAVTNFPAAKATRTGSEKNSDSKSNATHLNGKETRIAEESLSPGWNGTGTVSGTGSGANVDSGGVDTRLKEDDVLGIAARCRFLFSRMQEGYLAEVVNETKVPKDNQEISTAEKDVKLETSGDIGEIFSSRKRGTCRNSGNGTFAKLNKVFPCPDVSANVMEKEGNGQTREWDGQILEVVGISCTTGLLGTNPHDSDQSQNDDKTEIEFEGRESETTELYGYCETAQAQDEPHDTPERSNIRMTAQTEERSSAQDETVHFAGEFEHIAGGRRISAQNHLYETDTFSDVKPRGEIVGETVGKTVGQTVGDAENEIIETKMLKNMKGVEKNGSVREILPKTDDQNNCRHAVQAAGAGRMGGALIREFSKTPKALHHANELQTIEDSLLYKTIYPVFFCMKLCGIFYVRRRHQTLDAEPCGGRRLAAAISQCFSLQSYCLLMTLVLFCNFIRTLAAFAGKFDDISDNGYHNVLWFQLIVATLAYEAFSRALVAYVCCRRQSRGFQELFVNLDQIFYPDRIIPYDRSLLLLVRIFTVLSVFMSVLISSMTSFGLFSPRGNLETLYDAFIYPVSRDAPGAIIFQIFILLLTFINTNVAMFSLTFHTVVCFTFYKEFEYLTRAMSTKIRADGQFTDDLEKFRVQHEKRCKLLNDANNLFKYYIGTLYICNVPLICLMLFDITYDESLSARIISSVRCLYVLLQLCVLSTIAVFVNTQAHGPLVAIHSIKVTKTGARQLEINMFLSKLTSTEIGLTAWDMFVINKPALLTVMWVMVTYYILLVQIQVPTKMATKCYCQMINNDTMYDEIKGILKRRPLN